MRRATSIPIVRRTSPTALLILPPRDRYLGFSDEERRMLWDCSEGLRAAGSEATAVVVRLHFRWCEDTERCFRCVQRVLSRHWPMPPASRGEQ